MGRTFETEIKGKNLAVVYMYTKSSKECLEFDQVYQEVAKEMTEDKREVSFFKMDIIENEVKNVKIRTFPTLYIYSKDWKLPKLYEKHFSKSYLLDFLETVLSKEFAEDEF